MRRSPRRRCSAACRMSRSAGGVLLHMRRGRAFAFPSPRARLRSFNSYLRKGAIYAIYTGIAHRRNHAALAGGAGRGGDDRAPEAGLRRDALSAAHAGGVRTLRGGRAQMAARPGGRSPRRFHRRLGWRQARRHGLGDGGQPAVAAAPPVEAGNMPAEGVLGARHRHAHDGDGAGAGPGFRLSPAGAGGGRGKRARHRPVPTLRLRGIRPAAGSDAPRRSVLRRNSDGEITEIWRNK